MANYVRNKLTSSIIDVDVLNELECIWVNVRPRRLPSGISSIAICAVYIVTDSPHQDSFEHHLLQTIDSLRTKYPDIGIAILGDFNRMNFSTRGDATLNLVITNRKLVSHYQKPIPL